MSPQPVSKYGGIPVAAPVSKYGGVPVAPPPTEEETQTKAPGFWDVMGDFIKNAPTRFMDFATGSDPLRDLLKHGRELGQQSIDAFKRGDWSTGVGTGLASFLPGIGDEAMVAGESFGNAAAGQGGWGGGLAHGMLSLAPVVGPDVYDNIPTELPDMGRVATGVRGAAKGAVKAFTTGKSTLPAAAGATIGHMIAGPQGAKIGAGLAALPGTVQGMVEGYRGALAPVERPYVAPPPLRGSSLPPDVAPTPPPPLQGHSYVPTAPQPGVAPPPLTGSSLEWNAPPVRPHIAPPPLRGSSIVPEPPAPTVVVPPTPPVPPVQTPTSGTPTGSMPIVPPQDWAPDSVSASGLPESVRIVQQRAGTKVGDWTAAKNTHIANQFLGENPHLTPDQAAEAVRNMSTAELNSLITRTVNPRTGNLYPAAQETLPAGRVGRVASSIKVDIANELKGRLSKPPGSK